MRAPKVEISLTPQEYLLLVVLLQKAKGETKTEVELNNSVLMTLEEKLIDSIETYKYKIKEGVAI